LAKATREKLNSNVGLFLLIKPYFCIKRYYERGRFYHG